MQLQNDKPMGYGKPIIQNKMKTEQYQILKMEIHHKN
jgi:hypothetical protein